jgi:hypothetical protein
MSAIATLADTDTNSGFTGSILTPGKIYLFEPEILSFYHTDYHSLLIANSLNP